MAGGAPVGNSNAAKGKQITNMIEAALNSNNKARLREGVEKIANAFAEGEVWALNMVLDRIEGKPAQAITGAEGAPLLPPIIQFVTDADSSDEASV